MDQVKADLGRHGFAIMEGALDADTTAAIRKRLLEQAAAEKAHGRVISNTAVEPDDDVNQWVTFLPNKGKVFRALMNNPACLETVRFILGQQAILSEFSAHITWPGNKQMGLHIDQWWLPHAAMPGEDYVRPSDATRARQRYGAPVPADHPINPPVVCNVMWMINDFTKENGATRLVSGSHLSGRHPDPKAEYEVAHAEGPAGSFVVWEGRTWHAASINTGNSPRLGITTYWGAPFCRQLLNFTYGLRPEVAADLSEEERALMGFKVWGTYGSTGDFNSPWASPGEQNLGEMKG
jgi:ectoine hydroxylase-related dioxygenase (phytanoyl-CoA dioxygenase family)